MASTPVHVSRRSSRLEAKLSSSNERTENLRKRRLKEKASTRFSSSSDSDENEIQLSHTPVRGRNRNNFTKVYSSYNYESLDGNFYYDDDDDFIDDADVKESIKQSTKKNELKRQLRRTHVKGGVVNESDDSSVTSGEDHQDLNIKRHRKKILQSSTDSDHEEQVNPSTSKRKRRRRWSSEDNSDHTPSRKSVRAKKLREKKEKETNKILRKLKQSRLPGSISEDEDDEPNKSSNENEVVDDYPIHTITSHDESSETNESDCEWIVTDEEIEKEGRSMDIANIVRCGEEIVSTMRLDSIISLLVEATSADDITNQLIVAAGSADPRAFIRCLTEGARVPEAVSILKEYSLSLVHLLIAAPWRHLESNGMTVDRIDEDCSRCLSYISSDYSNKIFKELVTKHTFDTRPNILELCVWNNRPKTMKFLLLYFKKIGWDWELPRLRFDVPSPSNWPSSLLHVIMYRLILTDDISCEDLVSVVETLLEFIDEKYARVQDYSNGNTALLYSAQMNYCDILQLLVKYKTTLKIKDSEGHSPLHLAAAAGCVSCVSTLLSNGHEVDCRDYKGWPPLLYAHFTDNTGCFLELMKAKPSQLSVLSDLMQNVDENLENRRKTTRVIRNLLISLAHIEQYYNLFNDFICDNMELLDDHSFKFMKHCMNLLSFKNKQTWMKRKLTHLTMGDTYYSGVVLSSLPRQHLLQRVLELLWDEDGDVVSRYRVRPLSVSFSGEAGICTGPRKEFWSVLSKELGNGEEMLFEQNDDSLLSLQPCEIILNHTHPPLLSPVISDHHRKLHIVGNLLAAVIFHGDNVDFNLTVPLTKQLLGQPLSPVEDLKVVDEHLYHQLKDIQEQDGAESLDLPFSVTLTSSWGQKGSTAVVDIPLTEGGQDCIVTDADKDKYVKLMSEFKLKTKAQSEISAFQNGFWKVLPLRYLKLFTPNEFSLLLSGVSHIDTDEWKANTKYSGLSESSDAVKWFWTLVSDLTQQEKGLLLKFTTGSPRLPPGGFKNLMGIGGNVHLFTLALGEGCDKIPQARTCFNLLILSKYSCEQQLRNKVLIAVRYGCEGFEFS